MRNSLSILAACFLLALRTAAAQEAPGNGWALSALPLAPPAVPLGSPGAPQGPPPSPAPAGNHDLIMENMFPPDLVMAHQKAIGLDDAQKGYIREELLKTQTRFTELQWQLQDAMESLVSLLKEDRVNEQQALAQLDKVLNSEREIKRAQVGLLVRIKNKLTPQQQAQLQQLRAPAAAGPGGAPQ